MKAYFTASVIGKQYHLDHYLKIIEILKSKSVDVRAEHILEATETTIRIKNKDQRLAFMDQLESWITASDFLVAETTFPSISVGYEISIALHRGKPVLILYNEGEPPSLIVYHHEDKVVSEKYTPETLPGIIADFVNFVRGASDIRFTFFITPQIAAFLKKVAKIQKIPKSVYLRKLIESNMTTKNH
ncbi:hypothetical protein A2154_04355 [Candidatus Gottesmanbacteria bacterium RBG_16_43_7]|uniref:2'-deoxynucleoside 5'-phosphate N-hydrolase 1 n=1 Tax=Candidatus Gottesmanbacteria bacterium RBG_16_43_7 TaxID=1798373 RepID=A0A1F5ZC17_9BACT|nr:MAG: hypothetical protein A2154_04355 [Candidatus Gottesmanbacteria bacterium RBG_16_43_7]